MLLFFIIAAWVASGVLAAYLFSFQLYGPVTLGMLISYCLVGPFALFATCCMALGAVDFKPIVIFKGKKN